MMQSSPSVFLRSPYFWAVFLILSLCASVAAIKLMFLAAPGLNLDITFSREQAVAAARVFQQQQFSNLKTERSAAVFISDRGLQNYVELEAGGIKVFQTLIPQLDAVTHYWKVRTFSPGQEEELITAFSPRGEPISFAYLISEKTPGAALEEKAARELAESGARKFMGERFNAYKTFETKQQRQASGRVDYTFTYEHVNLAVGEARFRIALKVAGDQLVAVDTFKHIPQAFNQRFDEMRSLNTQISQIASYLMAVIFGLGGLVGGGVWLFRRHQLRWINAFGPALVVGAGLGAALIANMPVAWMNYQTTSSEQTFIFQQLAQAGGALLFASLLFATIYAVAEGLTRNAFAEHPRLWDMFRPAAASPEILGRLLGAFAWTGFFLLYAMAFYWFSTKVLGWWNPADITVDPNILASWRPALGPIFTALQAGTWEECLFRAIPLSLAVIIGNHYGFRNKLVIFTLIAQALIFGGAHANYPNLPGYSRLIELFIPALVFGLVYLRFGLMVSMITHFEYDLVLMSLPIFTATDASLWVDRVLVVLAGVAPLLVFAWACLKRGQFTALADEWRNGVVEVVVPVNSPNEPINDAPTTTRAIFIKPVWSAALVIISVVLIIATATKAPRIDWTPYSYQIDRHQARVAAENILREKNIALTGEWHSSVITHNGWSQPLEYVWRETGAVKVQGLIGKYLDKPFWVVSWRKFDGPVEERAEEWQAWLYPDGSLHELVHKLPEARAGEKLSREQAIVKAQDWIRQLNWADSMLLEEKSVEEIQRPARSDWVLTYLDKPAYDHNNARAAIIIKLAGDEVVSYVRTIDIPEAWTRAESEEYSRQQPYRIIAQVALLALVGCAALCFFRKQTTRSFSFKAAWPWIAVGVVAQVVVTLLWFDQILGALQTTMGWWIQIAMMLFGMGVAVVAQGVVLFFAAQAIHGQRPRPDTNLARDFMLGATLAFALTGFRCLLELTLPSSWAPGSYSADWATPIPWLTTILNGFKGVFPFVISIILALGLVRFSSKPWRFALISLLALIWLFCSSLASREFPQLLGQQLYPFIGVALAMLLIRSQQMGVALVMFGMLIVLRQLGVMHAIYPGALWHALLSAVICSLLTYGLVRHWYRRGLE